MKNKVKVISTLILLLLCIGITVVLFLNNLYNYLIVLVPVTLMAAFSFITEYKNSFASEKEIYETELNKILKTYDGILVNTNKFPKLKNKSVLHVSKIEDLVDAQAEMRKPIYYVRRETATAFYLLNDDIFLIYFLKQSQSEICGLEAEIRRLELEGSLKIENFKDIDKTFILQTDEKSYKVSPIREKKEEEKEEKVEEPKEENKIPEVVVPEEETSYEEEPVVEEKDTEIAMPVFEQAPIEEPEPYEEPEEVIETGTIEEEVFEENYSNYEEEHEEPVVEEEKEVVSEEDEEVEETPEEEPKEVEEERVSEPTPAFENNNFNPNKKKKKKKKKKKHNNGQNPNFNQQ